MNITKAIVAFAFAFAFAFACLGKLSASAQQDLRFDQLPAEVKQHIRELRKSCIEEFPDVENLSEMTGIKIVSLSGSGSRDLFIDDEEICGRHPGVGVNCSDYGCDFAIYEERAPFGWRRIFDEHLYTKHLLLSDGGGFRQLTISISASSPKCQPDPRKEYHQEMYCSFNVIYKSGRLVWHRIKD